MSDQQQEYRVLARKYRPRNFDELIGQDALVRTLTNAIESNRLHHAYMLTGVRGVGKTTTARIIAKAINYKGKDGKAGPTAGPTDDCTLCQAISESRHPDVLEMDAASRTGVGDIRELIEGVRYAPTEARYKVYIIDEVHMLSTSAFNALLKTLEEPPPHVKFIFATTEIREVPVTILSRCQRFDLRRVDEETLLKHYTNICGKETIKAEEEALRLISRAADGSVRDGLSLLDQAIALGQGNVATDAVKEMLGLADRGRVHKLFVSALSGDTATALTQTDEMHKMGIDPLVMMKDMLAICHQTIKTKVVKGDAADIARLLPEEREQLLDTAAKFSMPGLHKAWQILLKGIQEIQQSPQPAAAAEVIIVRLGYAALLPDPTQAGGSGGGTGTTLAGGKAGAGNAGNSGAVRALVSNGSPVAAPVTTPATQPRIVANSNLDSLEAIVACLEENGAMALANYVRYHVGLIKLQPQRIEVALVGNHPKNLASDLAAKLTSLAGQRWVVSIGAGNAQPTLRQQEELAYQAKKNEIMQSPLVQELVKYFPGVELTDK
ncbi:MAG: DNA polymerase III subunit gamma/tau [Alphaproteobacteria bacterium]|nr:DNA polymerase III subunit gamma/tau [Alphaproteobacteria bacterium]